MRQIITSGGKMKQTDSSTENMEAEGALEGAETSGGTAVVDSKEPCDTPLEKLVKSSTVRRLLLKEYPRCKVYRGTISRISADFFSKHPKYSVWTDYDPDSEIWIVEDKARKTILHIEEYIPRDIEIDANVWPFVTLKWLIYAVTVASCAYIVLGYGGGTTAV